MKTLKDKRQEKMYKTNMGFLRTGYIYWEEDLKQAIKDLKDEFSLELTEEGAEESEETTEE